ncbi:oxidoreductase, short-chain dehydrogenase/reductase family [Aspergillus stella-maris]|uniref:oxidoreductase, short-chain dehydrogenase/reductase family n=1 Tax=Aspergillus stella-maris TaxID=1810926 RepID=UPI003CCD764D
MSLPYKHVLAIGATAGIGWATASRLIESGVKVTVVGRRQERIDKFVQIHGGGKASGVAFDITKLEDIPGFAGRVMKNNPDIDCIFLNAAIQNPYDLTDVEKFPLDRFHQEVKVNFTSLVSLTHAFLPYLLKRPEPSSFIFTGTHLAIIPAATLPAYSASKAALNVFVLCLREQLRVQKANVKVTEISPPVVQTELHDYMGEEKGRSLGMPIDEFTDRVFEGLREGKDQIVVGSIGDPEVFNEVLEKRREQFGGLARWMRGGKD